LVELNYFAIWVFILIKQNPKNLGKKFPKKIGVIIILQFLKIRELLLKTPKLTTFLNKKTTIFTIL